MLYKKIILFIVLATNLSTAFTQVVIKQQKILMGSVFDITIVAEDTLSAKKNIKKTVEEITRIEHLISEWNSSTQISEVNKNAGIRPVKVDREVFELTQRAIRYSEMSGGAFDISIAGMDRLWRFDGSMTQIPTKEEIAASISKVGYQNIILDSAQSTIYLSKKGMRIGFGSIGKGYAADRGRALMKALGVTGGIVNAAGDLSTWGEQPDKKPWFIGISNPINSNKILRIIKMKEASAATSGNYQKYVEFNGVRYAHIINPKTGYPSTGLTSVTIYGPSAEFSNALSTSVMVMGKKEGIQFLKKFPDYKYIIVTDKGKVIKKRMII